MTGEGGGGGFGLGDLGGMNIMGMMQKVGKLKADLEAKKEEVAKRTVEATAGGGIVRVVATGDGVVKSLEIDPAAIVPSEKELLEDLVKAAVNEAREKGQRIMAEEMAKLTAGLPIPPGLF